MQMLPAIHHVATGHKVHLWPLQLLPILLMTSLLVLASQQQQQHLLLWQQPCPDSLLLSAAGLASSGKQLAARRLSLGFWVRMRLLML
jgi:hypothetical protein